MLFETDELIFCRYIVALALLIIGHMHAPAAGCVHSQALLMYHQILRQLPPSISRAVPDSGYLHVSDIVL